MLNSAGVATGGLLRDVYNTNPSQIDLPYQLVRGEQTVDNFEIGIKADWLDGRLRTNVTVVPNRLAEHDRIDVRRNGLVGPRRQRHCRVPRVPCAARCDGTNTYEVNYFPNLLTSARARSRAVGHRDRG